MMLNLRWWEPESKKGNDMDKVIWRTEKVILVRYADNSVYIKDGAVNFVYMDDSELTALSMEWLAQKGFEVTKKKIRPRHCPLCGGKAYTIYSNDEDGFKWWYTYCDSCKIRNEGYKTEEEAIEAWNALPRGDQRA